MRLVAIIALFARGVLVQTIASSDGYTGYSIAFEGDADSVVYETTNTPSNASDIIPPDVFLNASVHVGEISVLVANLSAEINLQAQVLDLLEFNAGVDVSIDQVSLLIQNVTAKVLLEARLNNLLLMVNDTLNSLDLNPILASLSDGLGEVIGDIGDVVGGVANEASSTLSRRSFEIENNILYSINDYSGNTHTNRVLSQTGAVLDQALNNKGDVLGEQQVGSFQRDMAFTGSNLTVIRNGQVVHALEYVYQPFIGISVTSEIYLSLDGDVVATQVLAEASGGGGSTIEALEEQELR